MNFERVPFEATTRGSWAWKAGASVELVPRGPAARMTKEFPIRIWFEEDDPIGIRIVCCHGNDLYIRQQLNVLLGKAAVAAKPDTQPLSPESGAGGVSPASVSAIDQMCSRNDVGRARRRTC